MVDQNITPNEEAINLQKYYYDSFGDRDWNEYKHGEHGFLKRSIGFAIFGGPEQIGNEDIIDSESGYNEIQCKTINEIYDIILKNNFHETSIVHIRYISICCVSINQKTLTTEPVFVIRKCRNQDDISGKNNCKIYIDSQGRVYQSWNLYLANNKLPKCTMMYPKNGEYSGTIIGKKVTVNLDTRQSPACDIGNQVLEGTDMAATVVSVATTATFVAAIIPGIVVAPAVLVGAAVGGIGVGLYSVGRSIHTLVDRAKHDQSIGLDNAESRWCWLNTTVGVLGVGTSAATGLLTKAASTSTEIGEVAQIAYKSLTAASIVGSGVNIVLGSYNVIDKLINDEKVTSLEVFQLTSAMLFFHNSVTSFQTASIIISETQFATLEKYKASLCSNRHRKLFKKTQREARRLRGETAGKAEIISGMRNINDPDNFFAGLAHMNKKLNRNGARLTITSKARSQIHSNLIESNYFAALVCINKELNRYNRLYTITGDSRVQIKSNFIINPLAFATIGKDAQACILKSLPPGLATIPVPKVDELIFAMNQNIIKHICTKLLNYVPNLNAVALHVLKNQLDHDTIAILLEKYSYKIIQMFLKVLVIFLDEINDCLNDYKKLYPFISIGVGALQFIIAYVENISNDAQMKENDTFLKYFFIENQINLDLIEDMANLFKDWLQYKIDLLENQITNLIPANLIKPKVVCIICGGHHYAPT